MNELRLSVLETLAILETDTAQERSALFGGRVLEPSRCLREARISPASLKEQHSP